MLTGVKASSHVSIPSLISPFWEKLVPQHPGLSSQSLDPRLYNAVLVEVLARQADLELESFRHQPLVLQVALQPMRMMEDSGAVVSKRAN